MLKTSKLILFFIQYFLNKQFINPKKNLQTNKFVRNNIKIKTFWFQKNQIRSRWCKQEFIKRLLLKNVAKFKVFFQKPILFLFNHIVFLIQNNFKTVLQEFYELCFTF